MQVWNMVANGMGGIDWAGFPLACEIYRVRDVDQMIRALLVIKAYEPPEKKED